MILGIVVLLLSLCHGVVSTGATSTDPTSSRVEAAAGSERSPSHAVECVARAKAIAPMAKRITSPSGVQTLIEPLLWLATREEGIASSLVTLDPPVSGDSRALLQVFRI